MSEDIKSTTTEAPDTGDIARTSGINFFAYR